MAGLTTEQMNAMGATNFKGSLSDSQMKTAGGKQFTSDFSTAQGALGHSQGVIDASKVFQTPLTNITSGNGQDNLDHAKGALTGLAQGIAPAGAQNAGPIGADMLAHAPEFAKNIQGLTDWNPANTSQAVGQAEGAIASFALPGEAEIIASEKAGTVVNTSPLSSFLTKRLGQGIQNVGKSLYKFFLPQSEKDSALLQSYKAKNPLPQRIATALTGGESNAPRTMAETAFDQGLKGSETGIGIRAKRASSAVWNEVINPALQESDKTHKVSMNKFFDEMGNDIKTNNPEPSRQNDLLEGLQALREDYKGKDLVKPSELQSFKEAWAEHLPNKAFKGKEIGPAFNQIKNLAADKARTGLHDLLGPQAKEAYFDYGNLKSLQELGVKAMTGKQIGSSLAWWDFIKNKAIVPISTVAGRSVYRTGEGIEFVGNAGAKTLADLDFLKAVLPQESRQQPTQPQI